MEVTVQHDQVVRLDVDDESIDLVLEEKVQVTVVQQVYDIMQTHHVTRQHVQINQVIQPIQVTQVVIVVICHVIQTIIKNEVVVYIIGGMLHVIEHEHQVTQVIIHIM